jgi:hypothetical protein
MSFDSFANSTARQSIIIYPMVAICGRFPDLAEKADVEDANLDTTRTRLYRGAALS